MLLHMSILQVAKAKRGSYEMWILVICCHPIPLYMHGREEAKIDYPLFHRLLWILRLAPWSVSGAVLE